MRSGRKDAIKDPQRPLQQRVPHLRAQTWPGGMHMHKRLGSSQSGAGADYIVFAPRLGARYILFPGRKCIPYHFQFIAGRVPFADNARWGRGWIDSITGFSRFGTQQEATPKEAAPAPYPSSNSPYQPSFFTFLPKSFPQCQRPRKRPQGIKKVVSSRKNALKRLFISRLIETARSDRLRNILLDNILFKFYMLQVFALLSGLMNIYGI
ncbi:hypothetical protein F5882DRAFT_446576 [Hyaloscypha sp. PMI_1271]|nr:hypothetical protein F5882DRAFT_446576 [Hyaloscypha sp. PMI_1271]